MLAIGGRAIKVEIEDAILGRHFDYFNPLHQLLARAPKLNQVFDAGDLQPMANGKAHQFWKTRHRTVVAEDLANDAHGTAASQLNQIDSGFGMACALKNP